MHRKFNLFMAFALVGLIFTALAGCGSSDETIKPTQTPEAVTQAPLQTPDITTPVTATPEPNEPVANVTEPAESTDVAVMVINVGYGDAILVQLGGQNFLIDTGAEEAGAQLLSALALRSVNRLDGVFLTHTHSDHIGGLETAARRYDIGMMYAADISQDTEKIDKLASELGLGLERLSAGDAVQTDSGAVFEVLGPLVFNADDDNDNSLVLRLKAGGLTWLFAGDMQFDEEISLMNAGDDLKADVLKVGNHGNPDATSEAFGKATAPETAVISTSTKEDGDSANQRVISALGSADVYVTQDYMLGVLLTAQKGELTVDDPQPKLAEGSVQMDIDLDEQTVTLTGDVDIDISGWIIYSDKGGEQFVFPQGATLTAGQPLIVTCWDGVGDYIWDAKKVWSKKNDTGVLITNDGAVAARKEV